MCLGSKKNCWYLSKWRSRGPHYFISSSSICGKTVRADARGTYFVRTLLAQTILFRAIIWSKLFLFFVILGHYTWTKMWTITSYLVNISDLPKKTTRFCCAFHCEFIFIFPKIEKKKKKKKGQVQINNLIIKNLLNKRIHKRKDVWQWQI